MDLDHWYRCSDCGYMYTPQQVLALVQLLASRTDAQAPKTLPSDPISCRKKGCTGTLIPTKDVYRDSRR